MINLYATLIINHRRSFEQVPENLKNQVQARLDELGYDIDGNPKQSEGE